MRFQFHAGADVSELDLVPARWTVGGDPSDGVRIVGLPRALLELAIHPGSVWLRGVRSLRVGRAPLDRDVWRLLLPGESVELGSGCRLRLPPVPPAGTSGLFRALALHCWPLPRCAAAALVAVAGPDAGETFSLLAATEELGRFDGAAVRLRDPAVSRRQLSLVRTDDGHRAEPRRGPNPVRRNGRRLRAPALLREGDVLGVGRTLLCYFTRAPGAGEDPGVAPRALSAGGTARRAPPAAPSAVGAG